MYLSSYHAGHCLLVLLLHPSLYASIYPPSKLVQVLGPLATEPTKYLVYYHNKPSHDDEERFSWSKHEFQVVADPENEIYECECKLWTHTGERKNKLIK